MINLRRSNYIDKICDGRRAVAKEQKNCLLIEFRTRFHKEVLLFLEIPEFLYNTVAAIGLCAENQLDLFICFDITPPDADL